MATTTGDDLPVDLSPAPGDGRVGRRERNRERVVTAMVELIEEGSLELTMDAAAARAGVSVRSAFRYFDSTDDLRRQTVDLHLSRVDARLRHLDPADHDRIARIEAFVDDRLAMFEAQAGPARVARRRAEFLPIVAGHLERIRRRLAEHVRVQFDTELAMLDPERAGDVASLVDVVVSRDSWDGLHEVHGRDRDQIRRTWIETVDTLLP